MTVNNIRLLNVNADTGEIVEGAVYVSQVKRAKPAHGRFFMLSQAEWITQLIADGIGFQDLKVLHALFTKVDFENWINVDQGVIAKMVAMRTPHVSRSIGNLIKLGVLIKGPKVGRFATYRMNPAYGWKGKPKNYQGAVVDFDKARSERDSVHSTT